ncbi:SGNH/GDSL hydrolase family protein [Pseudidiomarina donghaiensis]|uniref:SGNH/GDSL hydrolase family protein n=1 Tax=Pseudidiomarina donghaiensis TaxID=519452 RepID=UPI000B08E169|nr:SGNH/GDSL hydrolase family protein [Pseudidiomarina donghaiensis]
MRSNTLRLPEAAGEREGVSGNGEPMRLLILGDSAAAGVGCSVQSEALCGRLVNQLGLRYRVHWQLWAKSGLTCAGILKLAKQQPAGVHFDVVVISAGVNDVTKRTTVSQWRADLLKLTNYLQVERGAPRIIFTAVPPMHKFPALPQPLRWFIGQQAKQLNIALWHHCVETNNTEVKSVAAKCDYLTFDFPFEPEYMARDGFHPSSKAAALWADSVLTKLV